MLEGGAGQRIVPVSKEGEARCGDMGLESRHSGEKEEDSSGLASDISNNSLRTSKYASQVESLPSMGKSLGPIPRTERKKKKVWSWSSVDRILAPHAQRPAFCPSQHKPVMVTQVCNPSIQEVVGLEIQSHPQLHKELESSLGSMEPNPDTRPHPTTNKGKVPVGGYSHPRESPQTLVTVVPSVHLCLG